MERESYYLDYQATTPVDPLVFEAMQPYFFSRYYNPSSVNFMSAGVHEDIQKAREVVAHAIGASSNEVYFTSGATESINLALKGFLEQQANPHVVTLAIEHSAVLNTCRYIERKGATVTYLDVGQNGILQIGTLISAISGGASLVAIMHANNEIGTIQPIHEIGRVCEEFGIPLFVDAAQSFGKLPIKVSEMNIGMLAISGHKIYGPKGVGALYVSKKLRPQFIPQTFGGGQEGGLRSGTLNVPGIIGLAEATKISIENMEAEQSQALVLRKLLLQYFEENLSDFVVNGDLSNRLAGNLNISFRNVSGDVLLQKIENIIISRGSACNSTKNQGSHVLSAIGLPEELADSAIRISIGRFTTEADVLAVGRQICLAVSEIRRTSMMNRNANA